MMKQLFVGTILTLTCGASAFGQSAADTVRIVLLN
jgi:hypothetical protein